MSAEVYPLLLAEVRTPDWHPQPNTQLPVYGYLVLIPAGAVLVDTGVGDGSALIEDAYRPERHSLDAALAEHGITARDVVAVVNTHLHFDHCGGNRAFRNLSSRMRHTAMKRSV